MSLTRAPVTASSLLTRLGERCEVGSVTRAGDKCFDRHAARRRLQVASRQTPAQGRGKTGSRSAGAWLLTGVTRGAVLVTLYG